MSNRRRLIGLDLGLQQTGIAVSDELGLTARPLEVVPTKQLAARLGELLAEYDAGEVIVGRPRNVDGSLGEQAEIVERQVAELRRQVPAEFHYEDETATTLAATDGQDDQAAYVMLQGYLQEHS